MVSNIMNIKDNYNGRNSVLGFWVYIMSDCILFATLFAVYAVFQRNTFGGPGAESLFSLPFVFIETIFLLLSSFTFGLATLSKHLGKKIVIRWLWVTFILGSCFIYMEIHEFYTLYIEGHSWENSAFLSSFFVLVGTHGLHVTVGLIWIISMIFQLKIYGINPITKTKLTYLGLFWHFLDIVWIFVFSIVYLMGAI